jgi:hypothetical protein
MTDRDVLIHAIAFALIRCKAPFHTPAQSQNTDHAGSVSAEIIADQIEQSGLSVRQRRFGCGHSTRRALGAGDVGVHRGIFHGRGSPSQIVR